MQYNPNFTYPNIELWYDEPWKDKNSLIDPLFQWIGCHDSVAPSVYARPAGDPFAMEGYQGKSNSVDVPSVIEGWKRKGLRMTTLEQGCKYWISMVPEQAGARKKCRALVVLCQQDSTDPWWAMEVQERYRSYNERAADGQDTVIIYLTAMGADKDRIFGNILQEACVLYPVDLAQVYLDVSVPVSRGQKLSEIQGFVWKNEQGQLLDPDGAVEQFWGIPVLNISGRWGSKESLTRGLVMHQKMNEGNFDREWLIHSEAGAKMAQGILLEHRFDTVDDPGYRKYWAERGVDFRVYETEGRRWTVMSPAGVKEPLPVVLTLQEVYRGNEHLAVTAGSYFCQLAQLVAEGNCIALFFALEDPDSNELIMDILEEAKGYHAIDASRVYAMGHSHDGWFTRILGYRHADRIAAIVTMGNHFGLPTVEDTGNDKMGVSAAELERMTKYDLPVMNIDGANEPMAFLPETEEQKKRWVREWQRRLVACNCPVRSEEEILAARISPVQAERKLGLPGDRGMTVWSDGFENYILDIQNKAGRYHLRVASTQNMPHTVTPPMIDLAWGFLRQFARDLDSGAVIELDERNR